MNFFEVKHGKGDCDSLANLFKSWYKEYTLHDRVDSLPQLEAALQKKHAAANKNRLANKKRPRVFHVLHYS